MPALFGGRFGAKMRKAAVRGLQDVGDEMFRHSQGIVNVDRGTLKKSGFIERLDDGVTWGYRAPYARAVNDGYNAHDERVRRHFVREHRRLVKGVRIGGKAYRYSPRKGRFVKGGKYGTVKAHWRGPFTRHVRRREGSHYMERSIDAIKPRLAEIVGRRLRMAFS